MGQVDVGRARAQGRAAAPQILGDRPRRGLNIGRGVELHHRVGGESEAAVGAGEDRPAVQHVGHHRRRRRGAGFHRLDLRLQRLALRLQDLGLGSRALLQRGDLRLQLLGPGGQRLVLGVELAVVVRQLLHLLLQLLDAGFARIGLPVRRGQRHGRDAGQQQAHRRGAAQPRGNLRTLHRFPPNPHRLGRCVVQIHNRSRQVDPDRTTRGPRRVGGGPWERAYAVCVAAAGAGTGRSCEVQ